MKYVLSIALALLALLPNPASAQEAKVAWFNDAAIANSGAAKITNPGTFTSVAGAVVNGIDLANRSADVTVTEPSLQQAHGMISFWLKPNGWGGTDTATRTFLKIGTTGTRTSNGILIEKKGTYLRFVMTGGPSGSAKTTVARGDISGWASGEWHHVAAGWMDNEDGSGKPLGIFLWIDKVCVSGPVWGDAQTGAAFCVPGTTVTIGGGSSYPAEACMDELIFRTKLNGNSALTAGDNGRPNMISTVFRDYFQTAPYTAIQIDNRPHQVASDHRVVAGYTKQFGLKGNFAGTGRMERITDFVTADWTNWSNFDGKPFISWTSSNTNVATVDANGLVKAKSGAAGQSCTLTAKYGPTGITGYPRMAIYMINVISPDRPDLDITHVERTPRYDAAVQQWPNPGSTVTFTAHITNAGYQPSAATTVKFEVISDNSPRNNLPNEAVDAGQTQTTSLPALAPNASTTVTFNWTWTQAPTFIRITANPGGENNEICNVNNVRCDLNIAHAFRWGYESVNASKHYDPATRVINGTGSFSHFDWCQAHIERWNRLCRDSVYSTTTPYGALDAARVDNFFADPATNPGWTDPSIWSGYNGQYESLGGYGPTYTSFIHSGVMHEIGHTTFELYDEYGEKTRTNFVHLKDPYTGLPYSFTPVLPNVGWIHTILPKVTNPSLAGYSYGYLMDAQQINLSSTNAGWIQYWKEHRDGHFWQVQGSRIPSTNILTFTDRDDAPLTGAAVYIYQVNNSFGELYGLAKYFYDRPKFMGNTDANGRFTIPSVTDVDWDDPNTNAGPAGSPADGGFAITNVFQTRTLSEAHTPNVFGTDGLFLIKAVKTVGSITETEFYMMSLEEFNEVWMLNGYDLALPGNYTIRTSLTGGSGTTAVVKPTVPEATRTTNLQPVAVAPDVYTTPNAPFTIDASGSTDPEGQPLTCIWTRESGTALPAAWGEIGTTLSGTAGPTYTDSTYTLYVFDGVRVSNKITVTVKVRGGSVSGRVKDSGGAGIAGALVGIKTSPKATADAQTYLTTDANGNYTSEGLMPGTYYVAAWKTDGSYSPSVDQVVTVGASNVTVPDIILANTGVNLIYNQPGLVGASYSDDMYWGPPKKANDIDTTLYTCWYAWYNNAPDPLYFYVDLGGTVNIKDVVIYRQGGWGTVNYWIDAMTMGNPLTPGDWNIPGNVQYGVYSALDANFGYLLTTPANRYVDAISLPLNNIKGLRIKMTKTDSTYYTHIYDLQVHTGSNKIGDVKALENGSDVSLTGKIVTAAPGVGGVPSSVFYIEETNRSSGIRVASSQGVAVGNSVSLTGAMATTSSSERYINAATVSTTSGTVLKPLGANTKTLAENLMEGLLVRVAGKVKSLGSDFYTISDGYTKDGLEVETKVLTGGSPGVSVGDFVTVTGVASRGEAGRVILTVP